MSGSRPAGRGQEVGDQDESQQECRRAKLDTALRSLMKKERPVVGVTAPDGRLIGLLTVENLCEMMMVRSARPDGRLVIHGDDATVRTRFPQNRSGPA